MDGLLALSRGIDRVSWYAGLVATWAILIVTLLAAGDALVSYGLRPLDRADQWLITYGIHVGFLLDWYRANSNAVGDSLPVLFAIMVMLGAPWTLKVNEHVRVDLIYQMLTPRGRIWVDVFGTLVFLLPACFILIAFTWPWFLESWRSNEMSINAGGLPRWPSKLFLPVGFALVALQGVSELIKCWGRPDHRVCPGACLRKAHSMIDFVIHNMAPLMFAGLVVFLLIGYPAAFALCAVGLFFGFIGIELGLIDPAYFGNLTFQLGSVLNNDLLLAIPLFTFMGAILEKSGLAEDLLDGFRAAFRWPARRALLRGDRGRRGARGRSPGRSPPRSSPSALLHCRSCCAPATTCVTPPASSPPRVRSRN